MLHCTVSFIFSSGCIAICDWCSASKQDIAQRFIGSTFAANPPKSCIMLTYFRCGNRCTRGMNGNTRLSGNDHEVAQVMWNERMELQIEELEREVGIQKLCYCLTGIDLGLSKGLIILYFLVISIYLSLSGFIILPTVTLTFFHC